MGQLQALIWNRLAGKHLDVETVLPKAKAGEKVGRDTFVNLWDDKLQNKDFAEQVQAITQEDNAVQKNLDVASRINSQAGLYYHKGRFAEAELLFRDALQMRKKLLGPDHPDVALTQWNLGGLYQKQKRYTKAKALYRQALAIAEAKLGPNHPQTQGICSSLESLPEYI